MQRPIRCTTKLSRSYSKRAVPRSHWCNGICVLDTTAPRGSSSRWSVRGSCLRCRRTAIGRSSPLPARTEFVLPRVALFVLGFVATSVDAASLERLRTFVRETQTARASFIQTVTDRSGRTVQRASGEFAIARPGHFRWSVETPYKQLLVGDGERV